MSATFKGPEAMPPTATTGSSGSEARYPKAADRFREEYLKAFAGAKRSE